MGNCARKRDGTGPVVPTSVYPMVSVSVSPALALLRRRKRACCTSGSSVMSSISMVLPSALRVKL